VHDLLAASANASPLAQPCGEGTDHAKGKTPEPRHSEIFPEVPIEERASAPSAERALTELTVTLQSIPEKLRSEIT